MEARTQGQDGVYFFTLRVGDEHFDFDVSNEHWRFDTRRPAGTPSPLLSLTYTMQLRLPQSWVAARVQQHQVAHANCR